MASIFKRIIMLSFLILVIPGCNDTSSGDYNGFIEEMRESSMIISPSLNDPEVDYPVYDIYFDENTEVEGLKENIADLERGDIVKVWVKEIEENKELATKVLVEE